MNFKSFISAIELALVPVLIPLLLTVFFTIIRVKFGNSVSALCDVLVFLAITDFVVAVAPGTLLSIAQPPFKASFMGWFFAFAVGASIFFVFSLGVEKKLLNVAVRKSLPNLTGSLPSHIATQKFPYFGVFVSWMSIVFLVAINVIPFTIR